MIVGDSGSGGRAGADGAPRAGAGGMLVGGPADGGASGAAPTAGHGGAPASDAATLDGNFVPSCQVYCMTDADCCGELGFGADCPDHAPERALCQIDLATGWDHVCRSLAGACANDAECQASGADSICAENAAYWCSASYCPGLNTCLARGCARRERRRVRSRLHLHRARSRRHLRARLQRAGRL
jgi:hypothetical protein